MVHNTLIEITILINVIDFVLEWLRARMAEIFRIGMQIGTRITYVPPRVRFQPISGHSGQFRPRWGFWLVLDFAYLKKEKKKKKKNLKHSSMLFWASLFLIQRQHCLFEPPHFFIVNISFVREHLPVGACWGLALIVWGNVTTKESIQKRKRKKRREVCGDWRRRMEEIRSKGYGKWKWKYVWSNGDWRDFVD